MNEYVMVFLYMWTWTCPTDTDSHATLKNSDTVVCFNFLPSDLLKNIYTIKDFYRNVIMHTLLDQVWRRDTQRHKHAFPPSRTHTQHGDKEIDAVHILTSHTHSILPGPGTNTSREAISPHTQEMVPFTLWWRQADRPGHRSSRAAHQLRPQPDDQLLLPASFNFPLQSMLGPILHF